MLEMLDFHIQRNEIGSVSYTIYKKETFKIKTLRSETTKLQGENIGEYLLTFVLATISGIWHQEHRQQI